ncbi:MAG: hypothetical protein ACM3UN_05670, partial [Bacillota bacterium]
ANIRGILGRLYAALPVPPSQVTHCSCSCSNRPRHRPDKVQYYQLYCPMVVEFDRYYCSRIDEVQKYCQQDYALNNPEQP